MTKLVQKSNFTSEVFETSLKSQQKKHLSASAGVPCPPLPLNPSAMAGLFTRHKPTAQCSIPQKNKRAHKDRHLPPPERGNSWKGRTIRTLKTCNRPAS